MALTRLAAIDVGTNSIRCIVVEAPVNGHFRVLDDEKATVRLGEGLHRTGRISDASRARAREALTRMAKIAEGLGADGVEAVATSAVRRADNGAAFVAEMADATGVEIRTIGGEEEAELAVSSARHHFDVGTAPYALLDLGGGSAEIVTATGDHVEGLTSVELGTVYLTERFITHDPVGPDDLKRLRKHARKTLRKAVPKGSSTPGYLIGSGGTLNAMGAMIQDARGERFDSVHRYEILRSDVVHLLAMLERLPSKGRRALAGLSTERADIIVAGVAVVDRVMRHLGTNLLRINGRGIREGLILKALADRGVLDTGPRPAWRDSVLAFARSCHTDLAHAEHVARSALSVFDALTQRFGFTQRDRVLLEAAALLHDVGYFIDYTKHHRHSYHLIRHANLFDFTPLEREVVACTARYHRKAMPKVRHEGFGRLGEADQALVCRLGGILRLADGLDRRRRGAVEGVAARLLDANTLVVGVVGTEDLSVELHGARSKSDLLDHISGIEVRFEGA